MNSATRTVQEAWRRLRYVSGRFTSDRCSESAAALTYMSLFALVPLLTLVYTMASAIPTFQGFDEQIQSLLYEHLLPESSSEIEQYLNDFSRQAKNLTGPGIAFLLITAVLMLRNVEKSFNQIWRTREDRGAVSSFLLYWAVLTLGPATIGLALGVGTFLGSVADSLEALDVIGIRAVLLQLTPFLLSVAGFSLLYVAVPNCRVPFRHAIIGGAVAALAFNSARALFTKLVVGSNYTLIYGAFAAVPLFLLWIYLSWIIVLTGGILVHSLSAYQDSDQINRPALLKALDVLYLLWDKQKQGKPVGEMEILHSGHAALRGMDSETWGHLRDILLERKVITRNARGQFLLSRDLHELPLWQVKEWVNDEKPLNTPVPETPLAWQENAYSLLLSQREGQRELLDTNLAELFAQ